MERSGADILLDTLSAQGVDTIFGYPGGAVLDIFDALYARRDTLRLILTAHEQGAAHAADGYARSTGKTGVVLATSGPGATNLITGIATAYLDSSPIVAITGNVPRDLLGRDGFQEVNITRMTDPVVKANFMVRDASDMADTVRRAFALANSGRRRPVLIDIPKDVAGTKLSAPEPIPAVERFRAGRARHPELEALRDAASIIAEAKRPLIFAGGGVTYSGASPELLSLAEKINAPICVTMMGISSVPYSCPFFLGMVGMHGSPTANLALRDCDALIAVGTRFSDRVAGNRERFAANARIIHMDIDPAELGKNVAADLTLACDARDALRGLEALLPAGRHSEWLHSLLDHKAHNALPTGLSERLTPHDIITGLRRALGEEGIVVTDVGQHQMWTAQYYRFMKPRSFVSSCGLGTMGFGMGAAIGAKAGNPDRPVALVTGDGSFHMNLNELATAVTQKLPLLVLVMNNGVLGMVHQWQSLFYGGRYSQTVPERPTDFVRLAEAFGARGYRLEHKKDIPDMFREALASGETCVVDCRVDAAERVFPIIPPGRTEEDMIYCD